nr:Chain B, THR-ARG-SER-GLU-ILE-ARG-ARG-ALA-SER-THR-ILE-GLU [Homo sapiens]
TRSEIRRASTIE